MNHNPYGLKVGEFVLADNRHVVEIVAFTPLQMFATIKSKDDPESWQIMTARLKPTTNIEKTTPNE